jgi:polysaccharide export outer membrane protein
MQELEESSSPLVSSSEKYSYQKESYLLQINDIVEVNIKTMDEAINKVSSFTNDPANQNQMAAGGQDGGGIFLVLPLY